MIFEVKGDLDFFIILVDNSCLMCDFILFIIDGGSINKGLNSKKNKIKKIC